MEKDTCRIQVSNEKWSKKAVFKCKDRFTGRKLMKRKSGRTLKHQ